MVITCSQPTPELLECLTSTSNKSTAYTHVVDVNKISFLLALINLVQMYNRQKHSEVGCGWYYVPGMQVGGGGGFRGRQLITKIMKLNELMTKGSHDLTVYPNCKISQLRL